MFNLYIISFHNRDTLYSNNYQVFVFYVGFTALVREVAYPQSPEISLQWRFATKVSQNHQPEVHGCLLVDGPISEFTISFNQGTSIPKRQII